MLADSEGTSHSTIGSRGDVEAVSSTSSSPSGAEAPRPFSRVVRDLRLSRRWRQQDLAQAVGLDHSFISRIESGHRSPSPEDVERLQVALALTDAERHAFAMAYEHSVRRRRGLGASVLVDSEEVLETANGALAEARRLRVSGRPHQAAELVERSALWMRMVLRGTPEGAARAALLIALARTLAEQARDYLDFILPAQVGLVTAPVREQRRIMRELGDSAEVQGLIDLCTEGAHYLNGEHHQAHEAALRLLDHDAVGREWERELLRTCAVSAGWTGRRAALRASSRRINRLVDDGAVRGAAAASMLEGLARGEALLSRDPRATLQRAWQELGKSDDQAAGSGLRFVQLVRTEFSARRVEDARPTKRDERRAVEAVLLCEASGFARHRAEIVALMQAER